MTATETEFLDGERDRRFRVLHWPAPHGAGLLVIHHGHGEHAGRYVELAGELARLPIAVTVYDASGHGESSGVRGDAAGIEELASDLRGIVRTLVDRREVKHVFLLGHSMGGVVVTRAVMGASPEDHRPSGVILSAPVFRVAPNPTLRARTALGRALARVAPAFRLGTGLDPRNLSRLHAEVEQYRHDPLVHSRISVRLGLDLLDAGESCIREAASFTLPLLAFHGTADRVSDIAGTRAFVAGVRSRDARLVEFPGAYHEIHHEKAELRQELFHLVRKWLEQRLQSAGE